MTSPWTGGCLCGAIRYSIAAEPMMGGHCHCRDCQRMSGAGRASFLAFPETAMTLTGTARFRETVADSGNLSRRGFCTECGSWVLGGSTGMPGAIVVTAGSLDDPSRFKPGMTVYALRAHAWDWLDPALPTFEKMPPMMSPSSLSAETAETLRLVRHFPASPETVFRAWTDPGQLQRWWGPPGLSTPAAEVDLRTGGRYCLHMRAPDRPPFSVAGTFVEVLVPRRLVYTWQWIGTDNDDFESLITVEFRAAPPGTEVTLTHERLPTRYMGEHEAGWRDTLDRLHDLLAGAAR